MKWSAASAELPALRLCDALNFPSAEPRQPAHLSHRHSGTDGHRFNRPLPALGIAILDNGRDLRRDEFGRLVQRMLAVFGGDLHPESHKLGDCSQGLVPRVTFGDRAGHRRDRYRIATDVRVFREHDGETAHAESIASVTALRSAYGRFGTITLRLK